MPTTTRKLVTAEELWSMPERAGKQLELVNGEVVEMPGAGLLHVLIVALVVRVLDAFVRERNLGFVVGDNGGCVLRRDPDLVRIPDAFYVSWERLPREAIAESYLPFAPDLAVEVVSPNDLAHEVHEYLASGSTMVWVLWPRTRSVTVYGANGRIEELGPEDVLSADELLPGFRQVVAELFDVP